MSRAFLLAFALALAACGESAAGGNEAAPPEPGPCDAVTPDCATDDDCPTEERCGSCSACEPDPGVGSCTGTADCAPGSACRSRDGGLTCVRSSCEQHRDCAEGEACDELARSCVAGDCLSLGCPGAQQCRPDDLRCVECFLDRHCGDPLYPACDRAAGSCVECLADGNCAGRAPEVRCGAAQQCVECLDDVDCQGGLSRCAAGSGSCVQCVEDADCPGSRCEADGSCDSWPENGESCLPDGGCAPGFTCVGEAQLCRARCDPYAPACALGTTCALLGDADGAIRFVNGRPAGACVPDEGGAEPGRFCDEQVPCRADSALPPGGRRERALPQALRGGGRRGAVLRLRELPLLAPGPGGGRAVAVLPADHLPLRVPQRRRVRLRSGLRPARRRADRAGDPLRLHRGSRGTRGGVQRGRRLPLRDLPLLRRREPRLLLRRLCQRRRLRRRRQLRSLQLHPPRRQDRVAGGLPPDLRRGRRLRRVRGLRLRHLPGRRHAAALLRVHPGARSRRPRRGLHRRQPVWNRALPGRLRPGPSGGGRLLPGDLRRGHRLRQPHSLQGGGVPGQRRRRAGAVRQHQRLLGRGVRRRLRLPGPNLPAGSPIRPIPRTGTGSRATSPGAAAGRARRVRTLPTAGARSASRPPSSPAPGHRRAAATAPTTTAIGSRTVPTRPAPPRLPASPAASSAATAPTRTRTGWSTVPTRPAARAAPASRSAATAPTTTATAPPTATTGPAPSPRPAAGRSATGPAGPAPTAARAPSAGSRRS